LTNERVGNNSPDEIIRTEGLTKVYGGRTTVNRLNLTVRRGEIYGFLGPNGAGKTTTIRMILGLIPPTSGSIELLGKKVTRETSDVHRKVGVVGELSFLYDDMTALEYLTFFARLHQMEDYARRSMRLLEQMDLAQFRNVLARDFSQGMQKKLSLARALLNDPDVLILDEPVSGLDPYGILQVRELLQEKRQEGKTIFISSHILSEVERTADRVGIIQKGQMVIEDTVAAVSERLSAGIEVEVELQAEVPGLVAKLLQLPGVREVTSKGRQLTIQCQRDEDVRARVSKAIFEGGGVTMNMNIKKASLEDAFVKLTEHEV
jgi:ABC-2 type transport system ATP-binding protein